MAETSSALVVIDVSQPFQRQRFQSQRLKREIMRRVKALRQQGGRGECPAPPK
jgi:hypothetical protein